MCGWRILRGWRRIRRGWGVWGGGGGENITGVAENSARVEGSAQSRIRDVVMDNVAVTLDRWTKYKGGLFDNRPTTAQTAIEVHSTAGFCVRHVDNVALRKCRVAWGKNVPEYFTHALEAV